MKTGFCEVGCIGQAVMTSANDDSIVIFHQSVSPIRGWLFKRTVAWNLSMNPGLLSLEAQRYHSRSFGGKELHVNLQSGHSLVRSTLIVSYMLVTYSPPSAFADPSSSRALELLASFTERTLRSQRFVKRQVGFRKIWDAWLTVGELLRLNASDVFFIYYRLFRAYLL